MSQLYNFYKANINHNLLQYNNNGIQNIGNTCYLNSVIQALRFNLDLFSHRQLPPKLKLKIPKHRLLQFFSQYFKIFRHFDSVEQPMVCPCCDTQQPANFNLTRHNHW